MVAVEARLEEIPSYGGDLVILGLDRGELGVLLTDDLVLGEGGVGHDIGEDLHAQREVILHHFDGNRNGVVPDTGTNRAADMLDRLGDLLGGTGLRPLDDGAGKQLGETVLFRSLSKKPSAEGGDNRDKGKTVVLMDQNGESVGKDRLCDFGIGRLGLLRVARFLCSFDRIERGDDESLGLEIG